MCNPDLCYQLCAVTTLESDEEMDSGNYNQDGWCNDDAIGFCNNYEEEEGDSDSANGEEDSDDDVNIITEELEEVEVEVEVDDSDEDNDN